MANKPIAEDFQTVNESGSPVSDRIATPEAAHQIAEDLRRSCYDMALLDAKVRGMYDGNPPYNNAELATLGQGWRANINTREVKSAINSKAEAAYELHMEAPTRIEVSIRPEYAPNGAVPYPDWGHIIAEEYTKTLFDWPEGYFNIDLATRECLKYGLGLMLWENEWDWRPKAFKKSNFFVHPRSRALPEEIDICGFRDEITAGMLYDYIKDPGPAKEAGWDVKACKELLVRIYYKGEAQNAERNNAVNLWVTLQEQIKNREPWTQVKAFELVKIMHILYANVESGAVSHIIIPESSGETYAFLRKVQDRFPSMRDALWLLPYGYEDGYIGSLRGLGHELYTYGEISNRLLCSALDGGMISGGLLLQASTGFDADQLAVVRAGPVTIIPPALEAVQSTFSPPINNLIDLRNLLRGITDNNVGVFRARSEFLGGEREAQKTARQVVSEESKEARYDKNRANFEYLMWQRWHEQIFKRLTRKDYCEAPEERKLPGQKEAKDFVDRCERRGVPKDIIFDPDALSIKVARVIGLGSPGARMDITSQLMAVTGRMDETGRRYAEREWTAARVGYHNVDKYFPLRNRDKIATNEVSIATLENNDFVEGRGVPVGSDQLHAIHIEQAHEPLIINTIQAFSENPGNADLPAVYRTLQAVIPHYHEHVQYLQADPSRKEYVIAKINFLKEAIRFFQSLETKMAKLAKQQDALNQQRQAAQVEAIKKQVSEESQVRLREIEVKADLERMKQASLNDMRAQKTEVQNQIKAESAQQKAAIDRAVAENKIQIDQMLAQAKMELDRLKNSRGE